MGVRSHAAVLDSRPVAGTRVPVRSGKVSTTNDRPVASNTRLVCTRCSKSEVRFYYRSDGRLTQPCAECQCEMQKISRRANPERAREKDRLYRESNRDQRRAIGMRYLEKNREKRRAAQRFRNATDPKRRADLKRWRESNSEKAKASAKRWYETNRERACAAQKARRAADPVARKASEKRYRENYLAKHPERAREAWRRYRKTHPEVSREHGRQRRARLNLVETSPFDVGQLFDDYARLCAYCLEPATEIDHVVAITKGGGHTIENCVPTCRTCNSSKNNTPLLVWMATRRRRKCSLMKNA